MCVIALKDNHFLFKKHDAITIFPFIFIKESKKDNKALITHEKTHVLQVLQLRGLLYYFSKEMRYKLELEAYQNQLNYHYQEYIRNNPNDNEKVEYYKQYAKKYSEYMGSKYSLPIGTQDRAYQSFMSKFK